MENAVLLQETSLYLLPKQTAIIMGCNRLFEAQVIPGYIPPVTDLQSALKHKLRCGVVQAKLKMDGT